MTGSAWQSDPIIEASRSKAQRHGKALNFSPLQTCDGPRSSDKTPLDVKTDSADESSEYFRKERVSYSAAYAGERIPAILYLPKNARPPYQAVVWAPGGYAFGMRSIETAPTEYFKFLLRAGRAVLYPFTKVLSSAGSKGPRDRMRPGTEPYSS